MGDVTDFPGVTYNNVEPQKVLDGAKDLDTVLVLGWRDNDFYMAQSDPDIAETLLLIEIAREYLIQLVIGGSLQGKPN